jgi:hypothetical protein
VRWQRKEKLLGGGGFLYLQNIYIVKAATGIVVIPAVEDVLVEKGLLGHRSLKELATKECKACLGKGGGIGFEGLGSELCLLHFVAIPATGGSAYLQCLAVLLVEETEREIFVALDKLMGVSFWSDEDEGYWLVLQPSDASPRGGHGVETIQRTGRYQHPLLAYQIPDILLHEDVYISLYHGYTI